MQLNKSQLQHVIKHAIKCQGEILKRNDGHDDFNRVQFFYFKRVYKTAMHYYCNEAGMVLDGIPYLEYSELLEQYNTIKELSA